MSVCITTHVHLSVYVYLPICMCLGRKCVCMNEWLKCGNVTVYTSTFHINSQANYLSIYLLSTIYLFSPHLPNYPPSVCLSTYSGILFRLTSYIRLFFFFFYPNELFQASHLISHISVLQYVSFPCSSSTYFDVLRSAYPLNLLKKSACLPSCCVPPCTSLRPPSLPLPTPLFTARQPYTTLICIKKLTERKYYSQLWKKK